MKIKDGFLVKKIVDDYLVVPTGDNIVDFAVAVSLNESGAFLWEQLKSDRTKEDLVRALMAEYEAVDNATAEKDVVEFISLLKSHGFLSE
ncbi:MULTISPECIES: PqqD family protein [Congzhengia]|uniref:PqqD family protein n=1 Tax=Congzhengia minquanensis TaxID=2763657 RepID=A0A926HYT7_9FIRM|nr:PqqD family protein [Congzhengia minquanensis]MBC8540738.1 PqqD family protein [Congzhengia minquanensis]HBL83113.1 PqqD family protein [Clostridiales bacterium]